jgi:CheY-like chemotaxis protein
MTKVAGREILIVEDDKDIRDGLAEILEDEGYVVVHATNGVEGLKYLRAGGRPALILLDLMMPIMDGWQFRTEQLMDPVLAPIPVIVLTADGDALPKASLLQAVCGLPKPVRLKDLMAAVQRAC